MAHTGWNIHRRILNIEIFKSETTHLQTLGYKWQMHQHLYKSIIE